MTTAEHTKELYKTMGISQEVYEYGNTIVQSL